MRQWGQGRIPLPEGLPSMLDAFDLQFSFRPLSGAAAPKVGNSFLTQAALRFKQRIYGGIFCLLGSLRICNDHNDPRSFNHWLPLCPRSTVGSRQYFAKRCGVPHNVGVVRAIQNSCRTQKAVSRLQWWSVCRSRTGEIGRNHPKWIWCAAILERCNEIPFERVYGSFCYPRKLE